MKKQMAIVLVLCMLCSLLQVAAKDVYDDSSTATYHFVAELDDSFLTPENNWVYAMSENGILAAEFQIGKVYGEIRLTASVFNNIGYPAESADPYTYRFSQEHTTVIYNSMNQQRSPNPFLPEEQPVHNHLMIQITDKGTGDEAFRLWMAQSETDADPANAVSSVLQSVPIPKMTVEKTEEAEKNADRLVSYLQEVVRYDRVSVEEREEIAETIIPERQKQMADDYGYYYTSNAIGKGVPSAPFYLYNFREFIDPVSGTFRGHTYTAAPAGAAQFTLDTQKQDTALSNNQQITFTVANGARTRDGQTIPDVIFLLAHGNAGDRLYKACWKTLVPHETDAAKRTLRIGFSVAETYQSGLFRYDVAYPDIALDLMFDSNAQPLLSQAVLYWADGNSYAIPAADLTCTGNFVDRYLPVLYGEQADALLQTYQPQEQTVDTPDETEIAERLQALGLFSGTDTGFDLSHPFTRAQGAAMLVRLLGMETAALASSTESGFSDVPAGHWAAPYVGYCARNGITNGTSDTTFSPDAPMTGAQYATLLLRAMGYTDTQPDTAFANAVQTGLLTQTQSQLLSAQSPFLRGGMVQLSWGALKAAGANGKTMTDALLSRGVITAADAQQAKLVSPPPAAEIPQGDLSAMTEGIFDF